MQMPKKLSFLTLLLMISFASVNAVLFTPALPSIANYFAISSNNAQQTITWFLIGYALGQLVYGPIANRYGRKTAIYCGISVQIISSLLCILAGLIHQYHLLIIARFLLALGSGVGLKITFTLVNEIYEPKIASQKISYLLLAFAITPALAVAMGGVLNTHFGWISCFIAEAIYGVILLLRVMYLPETKTNLDYEALNINHLFEGYITQFKNVLLISGGFIMGCATSYIYIFAALAPFIAMNLLGMNSSEYGTANLIPAVGLLLGSLLSAQLAKKITLHKVIFMGISLTVFAILWMVIALIEKYSAIYTLFLPMTGIYFGLSLVLANASSIAMGHVEDKAHGSAVMNFINMGFATLVVLSLKFFAINIILLPIIYIILSILMMSLFFMMSKRLSAE